MRCPERRPAELPGSAVFSQGLPALPELGRQHPFCLCKQSSLGARLGLTQRSVLSTLGWKGSQARRWLRARWEPEPGQLRVCEPVSKPSCLAELSQTFWPRSYASDSSEDLTAPLLGKTTLDASPGWAVNVSVERVAK